MPNVLTTDSGALKTDCRIISQGEIERELGKEDGMPFKLPASIECQLDGKWRTWKGQLEPDGLFGIEYPDGNCSYIALEYQNTGKVNVNTLLGVSSMRRKYLAYANAYQTKAFNLWGIRNLRVLFVFANERDYRHSLILCEELFPNGSPMFLHTRQPAFRESQSGLILAPKPNPDLFTLPLERPGKEAIALYP